MTESIRLANRIRVTMKIESSDGDSLEMIRDFEGYSQGNTEDGINYMYSNFVASSGILCEYSIGQSLPIHFDQVVLKDRQ